MCLGNLKQDGKIILYSNPDWIIILVLGTEICNKWLPCLVLIRVERIVVKNVLVVCDCLCMYALNAKCARVSRVILFG